MDRMAQQVGHQAPGVKPEHDEEPKTQEVAAETSTTFTGQGALPEVAQPAGAAKTASDRAGYDSDPEKRSGELTAKHGVRPRNYVGALDGNNTAEVLIREVMPQITTFLNGRAAAQKFETRFTVAELTTNFLAEGGILAIKENVTENLDGFQVAGVDTFMDRYDELKPWLHPSIMKDRVAATQNTNEKGESVRSIGSLTLVQAAYANATMYAAGKARFEKWLKRHNNDIDSLSDTEQFYWSTTYYNAGEGYAEKNLAANGVGAANKKWGKADDWQKYYTSATYNAKMRTSTFEMTRDEAMTNDGFKPIAPEVQATTGAEVGGDVVRLRATVADLASHLEHYDAEVADLEDFIKTNKANPATQAKVPAFEAQLARLKDIKREHATLSQQLEILEAAQKHQLPNATTPAAAAPTPAN
jgi:hypothetical protein